VFDLPLVDDFAWQPIVSLDWNFGDNTEACIARAIRPARRTV